jgi:hypothetical protein
MDMITLLFFFRAIKENTIPWIVIFPPVAKQKHFYTSYFFISRNKNGDYTLITQAFLLNIFLVQRTTTKKT